MPGSNPSLGNPQRTGGPTVIPQANERKNVFIHPGQFHVAKPSVPTTITCILGSCVAVCLWDRHQRIGGAVHYLVPGTPGAPMSNSGLQGITDLVTVMRQCGGQPENMIARIFGGACMLAELRGARVGDRNIEVARMKLKEMQILVLQEHVGGEQSRKVRFFADSGEVTMELM